MPFHKVTNFSIRTNDPEPFGSVFILGSTHNQVVSRFGRMRKNDMNATMVTLFGPVVRSVAVVVDGYFFWSASCIGVESALKPKTGFFQRLSGAVEELARLNQVVAINE